MANIYSFDGLIPVVHPSSFIHPTATLIGDVIIGPGCYIGPGASLRGDFGRIEMRTGSNIQDNCVAHCTKGGEVIVEEDGHVGHGAILHGCTVGRNVMVGMNSVVMDLTVIGENTVIGAMAFVKSRQDIPAGHLVMGAPAKVIRPLTEAELNRKARGTRAYQWLAQQCPELLKQVDQPLTEVNADRQRVTIRPD
ncbi:transferase hexapeptide repeat family protein [Orrella sp. 11846]|uniref:acyltransferase n=1 Tax=Orrella sp. 11846 TaxID=3409913 RepID=UPI003B59C8DA